jgi:hypothetical protein
MIVLFLMAVGSFLFISHKISTAPTYSAANDKASTLSVAGTAYDVDEDGPQHNGLPVPVSRTVAYMRTEFKDGDERVHVAVHGTHIMVSFPKEPAVCVWVPVIVNGPKQPRIVPC